ncbi:MAG TPA: UDP-N-acetylmuramoyl-tripeptide--D-alanyl-D-alanine ligase [Gemmatimonadales bacterium]|nr:UDP-N-acetylmuramoyl-tripeptide--D-alanyl-D-alanine ligase [Gemmatimonadales bacterium]
MTAFLWNAHDVTRALGLPAASWVHDYTGVSTDTRSLKAGELFVALKGEHFDGHDFLSDARWADVGGVIVRQGTPRWPGFDWFEVDDTLVALGQLARFRRDHFRGPVVAITGTTGKTSTKELTAAALGAKYRVHRSERNLNNLVGVPLTVLAIPVEAEAAVVECGASVPGEIPRERDIVRPDVAVVTTVDAGHLEGFGSLENVLEEKVSLLDGAATAVVGTEPPSLPAAARRKAKKVVTAGLAGGDWTAENVRLLPDGRARFSVRGVEIELPFPGRHMVANAVVALAVADAVGVPVSAAGPALAAARLPAGRSEILELEGNAVINDTYNANPSSFAAALDLLGAIRGDRRVVVVAGTMRELGERSAELHRQVAELIVAAKPDVVAVIGEFVPALEAMTGKLRARPITGETPEAVAPQLKEQLQKGDIVLLKASRGVRLETIIPLLWPSHQASEAHA